MKFIDRAIAYLKASPKAEAADSVNLSPKDEPVITVFYENLHVCYLVDEGQQYKYVQHHHLNENGIEIDELCEIGKRNLKSLMNSRGAKVQPYKNIYVFLMGGDFEASALLLEEFWDVKFREFVAGNYAVVAPSRDVLAFCDASSEIGIRELQETIDRVWPMNDHLISDKIFLRIDSKWATRNYCS